jgi:D-alanine-D-alanine ligase
MDKLRVGVIFGGRSGEHEVSLVSGRSIMAVMNRDKYEIVPIGITHAGVWLTAGDPLATLLAGSSPAAATGTAGKRELVPGATGRKLPPLDVIFPVLHGPYGEDGTMQGLLELAGIPYVGCGVLASALAMDKVACKAALAAHGLPVTPWVLALRSEWEADPAGTLARIEAALPYPVFVKPANLGSSIGVSKATDRAALRLALADAARYDRRLLVEAAVPAAREIECAVLGNDDPLASVPGEVRPSNEFYDYQAKYIDGRSELEIPAALAPEVTAAVQAMAVAAFRAIDGAGLARVDFLLSRETGALYINEINTLPGFTAISMYPKLWEASGLPYDKLIDRLIELALERNAERRRSLTAYAGALSPGQAAA